MRKIWRGIVSTVFWAYERGSWPYDVMVGVILIFVLATPRHWFQDAPRPSLPATTQVQLLSENAAGDEATYRLDARLLAPEKRTKRSTPELERGTHEILSRDVPALNGRMFQVERIDPLTASDGSVLDYDVTVRTDQQ